MGSDFYPKAIIGVRIPIEKVIKYERGQKLKPLDRLGSQHMGMHKTLPKCPEFDLLPGMKNCPYCGCALYEYYENTICLIPGLHLNLDNCGVQSYNTWSMAISTQGHYLFIGFYVLEGSQEDDCAYIGLKHEIDIKDIEYKKAQLSADLEKVGLWDENEFGLWLFMYNSY